jgi:regulator of replication initiation timing
MNNSNYPATTDEYQAPRKNSKNVVIAVLAIAFLGTWGYLLAKNNSTSHTLDQNQTQIAKVTDEKSDIRKSFDESLIRLDSMSGINAKLKERLTADNSEISHRKKEIRNILNKKNATAAELAKAKDMINGLNDKISSMEQDVARLTHDNQGLTQDKAVLVQGNATLDSNLTVTTAVKQDLEKKVDVASTLNAYNISIIALDVKSNGKEKVTTTAKRVNKLVIAFDVNNRIAQPGMTDVFVCIIGPDGKNIITKDSSSNTFTTRDEGQKSFTAKLPVDVETAKSKNVNFAFTPGTNFLQGNYTIQIYQNGFKIGEGTRELKKGGLFS